MSLLLAIVGLSSDVLEGQGDETKDWSFFYLEDTGLTLNGVALSLGVPQPVSNNGGYSVRIGNRKLKVDPLDPRSLQEAIDAALEDAEETAEVVAPIVEPATVAKQQVRPVEVERSSREDAQAFAKFLAQVRSEYEAAVRTAMIIRLMKEAEDDDEEALLLLM